MSLPRDYNVSSDFLSSANSPHVNQLSSPESPPLPPDNPSILPPPLPIKSRDLMPRESPSPNLQSPEDRPPDSPPPLTRSSTARVSFREPISSSYSVDEDEDDDENENEEGLQEGEENQEDKDKGEGGFGKRLHLQKGTPPHMDVLGKPSGSLKINSIKWSLFCFSHSFFFIPDGSSYQQRHMRRGWGRCHTPSDPGSERRSRRPRPDRPRLDSLDWKGEKDRESRGSSNASSLTLQPGQYKHEDSCSTCSSSSDSEEEGYFLGQPIPLPPQLRKQPPEEAKDRGGEEGKEVQRDLGLRGSIRRKRAHSLGAKDKDKNCAIS